MNIDLPINPNDQNNKYNDTGKTIDKNLHQQ